MASITLFAVFITEIRTKRRLSVTNLSSENNLSTFRLNAPVVIRAKVKWCVQMPIYSYALLRIHVSGGQRLVRIAPPCLLEAEANLEATERKWKLQAEHIHCTPNSITIGWNHDKCHSLIYELCNCYLTQKRTESSKLRVKRF